MDNISVYLCLFPLVFLLAVLALILAKQKLWGASSTAMGLMWIFARMGILRLISNNYAPLLAREENKYIQSFLASDVVFAVTAVLILLAVLGTAYEIIFGILGRRIYAK